MYASIVFVFSVIASALAIAVTSPAANDLVAPTVSFGIAFPGDDSRAETPGNVGQHPS